MKKNSIIIPLFALLAMTSCNKQSTDIDQQSVITNDTIQGGLKVAYVEVDSLMTQFDFAKEKSKELEKKSLNARNTLTQKGNALQAAVNNFQQKVQNNGFTSREQAESAQAALQRQQNDLAALQARLENALATEQQEFLVALQDSLNNFLEVYNKDKKFDLILNKSAILYAGKKYDITQDVINGLNKRYKKPASNDDKAKDKK
jgi:outer membrane protein